MSDQPTDEDSEIVQLFRASKRYPRVERLAATTEEIRDTLTRARFELETVKDALVNSAIGERFRKPPFPVDDAGYRIWRDPRLNAVSAAVRALQKAENVFRHVKDEPKESERVHSQRKSWVYWATGACASPEETLAIAREESFLCHPLFAEPEPVAADSADDVPRPETDFEYLTQLLPFEDVLLMHNEQPLGWFNLDLPDSPETPYREVKAVYLVYLVSAESPLGIRLGRNNFPLHDGRQWRPGATGWFSGIRVRPRPTRMPRLPDPRPRGDRSLMSLFD